MQISWNDTDPIYRQLHDRIIELLLEGVYHDGDALPSVREIAAEHRINPITVSKAYQMLVDESLIEKRRGLGMFVAVGTGDRLVDLEREKFLTQEWPLIVAKIKRLGLSEQALLTTGSEQS